MSKRLLKFLLLSVLVVVIKVVMDAILMIIFDKTLSEIVRDFILNL